MDGVRQPAKRPATVLIGAIMSYVGGGVLFLVSVIVMLAPLDPVMRAQATQELDPAEANDGLTTIALIVTGFLLLLYAVAVILLAVFGQRGYGGPRIALTVLGTVAVTILVISVFAGAPEAIVAVAYVAGAVVLFWVGRANAWYAARKAGRAAR